MEKTKIAINIIYFIRIEVILDNFEVIKGEKKWIVLVWNLYV